MTGLRKCEECGGLINKYAEEREVDFVRRHTCSERCMLLRRNGKQRERQIRGRKMSALRAARIGRGWDAIQSYLSGYRALP